MEIKSPISNRLQTERRGTNRTPVNESLYLNYRDYHKPLYKGCAKGKDISLHGIRFACDNEFEAGTVLELTLWLSPLFGENKVIQTCARVIRCYRSFGQTHYRVACVFGDLDDPSRDEIHAFVRWLKDRG